MRVRRGLVLTCCGAVVFVVSAVTAQHREDVGRPEPEFRCGHAKRMAARFRPGSTVDVVAPADAPSDTDVLHYDLDIEISQIDAGARRCRFTGTNVMTIQSEVESLTEFTFRLWAAYTITDARLNGAIPVAVSAPSNTTRVATLDPAPGLGEVFTLTIAYDGVSTGGSVCVREQENGTPAVGTTCEPWGSHQWWPVKDGEVGDVGDFSDKFTMDFSAIVPHDFKVAASGVLQSVDSLGAGRNRYNWSTNYPMVPYLVSVTTTDFNTWTLDYAHASGTMPVEFYIYPTDDTPENRAIFEECLDMMAVFRTVFGEYPFIDEKYGMCQSPIGGMEHQTITAVGAFDEYLTLHELAHQWWGDMITCTTLSDMWLNEGFATYAECLWYERKGGGIDSEAYFSYVQSGKYWASYYPEQSVYVYPDELDRTFGPTTYHRGCWVLHQLRGVVGDESFFDILADYRSAYEYGTATTDEFAAVASSTYGQDLSWFFDQWVYGSGIPAYEWGWSALHDGSQHYVGVHIAQTHPTEYRDVFVMPVDLEVSVGGSTETVTVWNDARRQWFYLPASDLATDLQFDPNQWILWTEATDVEYVPGGPQVVSTSPVPGSAVSVEAEVDRVDVVFHLGVSAGVSDFSLVGDTTGPLAIAGISSSGGSWVGLDFDESLPVDTYTLTIRDTLVAAESGLALDGEIAVPDNMFSLPSGDGLPGGDAVIRFTIQPRVVPAASRWGLVVAFIVILAAATVSLRRSGLQAAPVEKIKFERPPPDSITFRGRARM